MDLLNLHGYGGGKYDTGSKITLDKIITTPLTTLASINYSTDTIYGYAIDFNGNLYVLINNPYGRYLRKYDSSGTKVFEKLIRSSETLKGYLFISNDYLYLIEESIYKYDLNGNLIWSSIEVSYIPNGFFIDNNYIYMVNNNNLISSYSIPNNNVIGTITFENYKVSTFSGNGTIEGIYSDNTYLYISLYEKSITRYTIASPGTYITTAWSTYPYNFIKINGAIYAGCADGNVKAVNTSSNSTTEGEVVSQSQHYITTDGINIYSSKNGNYITIYNPINNMSINLKTTTLSNANTIYFCNNVYYCISDGYNSIYLMKFDIKLQ
ncbi:hypothetical protein [Clostridium scatologenes]|uniref:Uncharacterized protein n=1 Tax=Clostridium scatologenes TaxID=1548 RepID=A0A0E3K1B8_CLOSL|nr:hypothetical protein [Clostridium scatologenes]AKA69827.1 hypothetical protein CSCA_2702 [Clostridium scatologenes]